MSYQQRLGHTSAAVEHGLERDAPLTSHTGLGSGDAGAWAGAALDIMRPIQTGLGPMGVHAAPLAAPVSPTLQQEVGYLNGLKANGSINNASYWGDNATTAHKWGASTAGTGATITYAFDAGSNFTAAEQATYLKAFAVWQSVADVHFELASRSSSANVLLVRGSDGGAYTSVTNTPGLGTRLGSNLGQASISIDTSVGGFDLSGSLKTFGGYGFSTVVHELGHLLGLGHGGDYNGDVNEATDQFSAYDERMWTTMSYIFWGETDAKFVDQYPVKGANWGITDDGIRRQAPHTVMSLDILAIQQLYGAPTDSPLAGGTTYGFHSTVEGPLKDLLDFKLNHDPVVTLFNTGTGNTLDVSRYTADQRIDLHAGAFSDVGGHFDNVAIAFGTVIENAVGGAGNDSIAASDASSTLSGAVGDDLLVGGAGGDWLRGGRGADSLTGGAGQDRLVGGAGSDVFVFADGQFGGSTIATADTIRDFKGGHDVIDLSAVDADATATGDQAFTFLGAAAFSGAAGELRYDANSERTMVYGDVDGDGVADFAIKVMAGQALDASDFVL